MSYYITELTATHLETQLPSFLETLAALSNPGTMTVEHAKDVLAKMHAQDGHTFVAIDEESGNIIGTIKVVLEQKFLRNGSLASNIEDVATHVAHQGKGVWAALVRHAIDFVRSKKAYKIVLDCHDEIMWFYEKLGFERKENCMKMYM